MIGDSGPPYRLSLQLVGQPNTIKSITAPLSPLATGSMGGQIPHWFGSIPLEDDELASAHPLEPVSLDNQGTPELLQATPDLAASAVWSEVNKNELDSEDDVSALDKPSSSGNSTADGLDEIAAEAELYVDQALAEASPFDDPEDDEIKPEDASPLHSTSFSDPDEATGAPTPATDRASSPSPSPSAFPLPPSIATFLSGLPTRADSLSSHLGSLLSEPATAPLRSLFTTAPQSVDDLPTLARSFAGELNNLLGSALSGVRHEANQLRDEFEALKVNIARDKQDLEDRLRKEWDDAVAGEKKRRGQSQKDKNEDEEDKEVAEEKGEDVAEAAAEAAEVNEKGLPMDPASRAARKQQRHEARLARKALRHAHKRDAKRTARSSKAASTSGAPLVETPVEVAPPAEPNPFDDFCASLAPSEDSEVASTLTRVSTPRSLIGAYPVLPSFPPTPSGPVTPLALAPPSRLASDDLFNRRVGGLRSSMPGSFNPSAPLSTEPSVDRSASAGYFVGNSVLSRSNTMPATATVATMPGAFSSGPAEGGNGSLFSGFVHRSSTPTPGQGGWAEVTPEQVKEAVSRLGFDLKDLGVRLAAERAWEELRGKTLAEMVARTVDKLV